MPFLDWSKKILKKSIVYVANAAISYMEPNQATIDFNNPQLDTLPIEKQQISESTPLTPTVTNEQIPINQLESTINSLNSNRDYLITLNKSDGSTVCYTIKKGKHGYVRKLINEAIEAEKAEMISIKKSDEEIIGAIVNPVEYKGFNIEDLISVEQKSDKVTLATKTSKSIKKYKGGIFPYSHNFTNQKIIDTLTELQIYGTQLLSEKAHKIVYGRCLVESLKSQIPKSYYDKLFELVQTDESKKEVLPKLANSLKINITIKYRDDKQLRTRRIHMKSDITCKIALSENHYYIYKDTDITVSNLINDDDKDYPSEKKMTTFDIVEHLMRLKDNYLETIDLETLMEHPDYYRQIKHQDVSLSKDLDIETNTTPFSVNPPKEISNFIIIDFEAYRTINNRQIPYMLCAYCENPPVQICHKISEPTVKASNEMIDKVFKDLYQILGNESDLTIFAHNLTYDIQFIIKHPGFYNIKPLINGGRFVSCGAKFFCEQKQSLTINFKDSYRIIPKKLSDIPKMLDIRDVKKEVMFHDLFHESNMENITNLDKSIVDLVLDNYKSKSLNEGEVQEAIEEFHTKIEPYRMDNKYNLMAYAEEYCMQDCRVAYQGLLKFNGLFQQLHPGFPNVCNSYSLPSIAENYFYTKGCYDGTCRMSGKLSRYFQQFVVGGRCMLAENKPQHIKEEIVDFDACSLYPSAMKFFPGFVKGTPKVITADTDLSKVDYYYVRVKITDVGKRRRFPVISVFDGVSREWTNDLEGKVVALDKIGLEDGIRFMDIKYEIIDGYYFDEGFNKTINGEIQMVYDRRRVEKRVGNNGLQETLKLLMNSTFGKHIQKTNDTQELIIQGYNEVNRYLRNNYVNIEKIQSIGEDNKDKKTRYLVKTITSIAEVKGSSPHLGCQILSYSKRIMNEVMCLAEDKSMNIHYQDTDSMQIGARHIEELAKSYLENYGRDLIGEDMGQFHSDFEVEGLDKKTTYSEEFIGLAKKTYLHRCRDKDGKTGYHIRAKGIPTNSLLYYCKQNKITVEDLYLRVLNGESFIINLLADNKVSFRKENGFQHILQTEVTRTLEIPPKAVGEYHRSLGMSENDIDRLVTDLTSKRAETVKDIKRLKCKPHDELTKD